MLGIVFQGTLFGRTTAVLTASDRCFAGTQVDRSGPGLRTMLEEAGAQIVATVVSPDDPAALRGHLQALIERGPSLILTTGGTGMGPRDNTPEATLAVCQRLAPGLAELLRQQGVQETPYTWLSRGVCGIAEKSLIVNLPGSFAGATSGLRVLLPLLPHALNLIAGHTGHPA